MHAFLKCFVVKHMPGRAFNDIRISCLLSDFYISNKGRRGSPE